MSGPAITGVSRGASRLGLVCAAAALLAVLAPGAAAVYPAYITTSGNCWGVGQVVAFEASSADVSQVQPDAIAWDFGDGATGSGSAVSHLYAAPGLRWVSLSVRGPSGLANTKLPIFISSRGASPLDRCDVFSFAGVQADAPRRGLPIRIRGRVVLPDSRGAADRLVGLRHPKGAVVALTLSGSDGRFAFHRPIPGPGAWRLVLLGGDRGNGPEYPLSFRPHIATTPPVDPVGPDRDLVVRGALSPAIAGKLVQLEFRAEGSWRPLAQASTGPEGRFALRYRFRRSGARYAVLMRVAAPKDRGWPYPTTTSRRFTVQVSG